MGALAVWLGAVALGDLVAAPGGHPRSRARILAGAVSAVLVAGLLAAGVGFAAPGLAALLVVVAVSSGLWLWVRSAATWSARRGTTGAVAAAGVFLAMVATAGLWPAPPGGLVAAWQDGLPFERLAAADTDRLLAAGAVAVALTATGNALVRLGLTGLDPASMGGEQRVKGGRLIGPVERLFIFGFVLTGQATAAALVISAKTLLRFPQLRWDRPVAPRDRPPADQDQPAADQSPRDEQARRDEEAVAEYLVCGSLLSWSVAVVGVLLLVA